MERSNDGTIEQWNDRTIKRSNDGTIERTMERSIERTMERSNNQTMERWSDRTIERLSSEGMSDRKDGKDRGGGLSYLGGEEDAGAAREGGAVDPGVAMEGEEEIGIGGGAERDLAEPELVAVVVLDEHRSRGPEVGGNFEGHRVLGAVVGREPRGPRDPALEIRRGALLAFAFAWFPSNHST
jgi:hypothetical protein